MIHKGPRDLRTTYPEELKNNEKCHQLEHIFFNMSPKFFAI